MQEYLPEIADGEFSFVFVGGRLTHTVRPAEGEFRVNSGYCPLPRHVVEPPRALVDDAYAVLDAIGEPTLYARIDGVGRRGRLICIEVELTDPSLYMELQPQAALALARETMAMRKHMRNADRIPTCPGRDR
jgi:hypothetical protein